MDAALWGLLGTIVGAVASIATTWLSGRSSHTLQQDRGREERAQQASSFQRQTLLELQEAIHDALRLVSQAHIEDREAHRATKEWGKNMLSDEVNEGIRLAQRRVAILVERVSDDDLRAKVKALMASTAPLLLARNEQESHYYLGKTTTDAETVFEGLGTVLRRHY